MNKINVSVAISVILIFLLILSCEKDDLKSVKDQMFGKLEIMYGDNQSGYFGEYLSDSIVIRASSNNENRKYLIKWEIIQGNGRIKPDSYRNEYILNNSGLLEIKWRLGCDHSIQKVKLMLYVDSINSENGYIKYYSSPSDSLIISANGIKPKGWARSCGCDNFDAFSSKIITFDNTTLYLVNHGLYSSIDDGLNWYKVEGVPDWENITDAQFNSLGWLYVLTEDNGICYSRDIYTWEFINNGIVDHRNPTAFYVEDSTIFVSFYFDGPYKTSNNGEFWRKMLVGEYSQRFYNITRHPNGDIYLFDDWGDLFISKNFGSSWEEVEIDYKYVNSPVYDLEIDDAGYIYIGASGARISKVSADTYEGEIHSYYEMNHSTQHVEDIKIINNIVYFTVNGNPTPGLYSSQQWQRLELGFNRRIDNYYLKKDGTFLLIADDGLFYYNE